MGTEGMKAILVSREVIADSIETVVRGHLFDGLVCLVGCDKTIPGAAMALLRMDLPGLVLYNGTIYPGVYKGKNADIVTVFEAVGAYRAGKITLDELYEIESVSCPGAGACGGQYTANTMSTVMEFIGLSPAGLNGIPAEDPAKDDAARRCGELVMDLVTRDVRPSAIVDRRALENGIASVAATGGSTNGVLHLLALAREAGIPLEIDDFSRIADATPIVADMKPGGRFSASEMYDAGGVSLVMRELLKRGLLHGDAPTVDGRTIAEIAAAAVETPGQQVVVPIETPLKASGGLTILRGTLAPEGCVIKLAGHERRHHRGPARVFDSENACFEAVKAGTIEPRRRHRHPLRGPGGRPRDAGDALGDGRARRRGPGRARGAPDRRALLRRHARPDDRPRGAGGGARRADRLRRRRRRDRDRRRPQGAGPARRTRRRWRPGARPGRRRPRATRAASSPSTRRSSRRRPTARSPPAPGCGPACRTREGGRRRARVGRSPRRARTPGVRGRRPRHPGSLGFKIAATASAGRLAAPRRDLGARRRACRLRRGLDERPLLGPRAGARRPGFESLTAAAALAHRVPGDVDRPSPSLANTFRHPAVLAKAATALDHVTGGRFILGHGSGLARGRARGLRRPASADGASASTASRRVAACAALLSDAGRGRRPGVTLDDPFDPLRGATNEPPPLTPAARRSSWAASARGASAGRRGRGWLVHALDRPGDVAFAERRDEILRAMEAAGRDPAGFSSRPRWAPGRRGRAPEALAVGAGVRPGRRRPRDRRPAVAAAAPAGSPTWPARSPSRPRPSGAAGGKARRSGDDRRDDGRGAPDADGGRAGAAEARPPRPSRTRGPTPTARAGSTPPSRPAARMRRRPSASPTSGA